MPDEEDLSLNAVRAFVQVARERSVTGAATRLGITQSSVSRHVAVLEAYFGAKLIERRGRHSELTEFGKLFADAVAEPLDTVLFTAERMRRRPPDEANRLVVRTSLSTFTYALIIPRLQEFSRQMGGAMVDVTTSLSVPSATDAFDVLLTRDLDLSEPADCWDVHEERIVCVGASQSVAGRGIDAVKGTPMLSITARPDILPTWLRAMELKSSDIIPGARYDHHYLALPAVTTGRCLMVTPEIFVSELIGQGLLEVLPGSRVSSGMRYRAYAVHRGRNPVLAQAFCRWVSRLCKSVAVPA